MKCPRCGNDADTSKTTRALASTAKIKPHFDATGKPCAVAGRSVAEAQAIVAEGHRALDWMR